MIPKLEKALRYIFIYDYDKSATVYIDHEDVGYFYVKNSRKSDNLAKIAKIDIISIAYSNKTYGDLIWKVK